MVKEFLSQKGIDYEEKDVSVNPAYAREMVQKTGQMGVPVTFVGDTMVIGFDRNRLEQLVPLMQTGQRPLFGAAIADASPITQRQGIGPRPGAYIGRVKSGSLAEKLGLIPGDIIVELNAGRVMTASDFEQAFSGLNPGTSFSVTFVRGKEAMTARGTI
jgi:glutaredoxin 3